MHVSFGAEILFHGVGGLIVQGQVLGLLELGRVFGGRFGGGDRGGFGGEVVFIVVRARLSAKNVLDSGDLAGFVADDVLFYHQEVGVADGLDASVLEMNQRKDEGG